MGRYQRIAKAFQKQLYNLLSSKCALTFTLAGFFVILISILQFGEVLVEWSMEQYEAQFSVYHDNIGGRSFEKHFTTELPVDVVYTWVNGTDPDLVRELAQLQKEMAQLQKEKDRNSSNQTEVSEPVKHNQTSLFCPFPHCLPWRTLVLSAVGHENHTHEDIASWSTCMRSSTSFTALPASPPSRPSPVFHLQFRMEEDVTKCLEMGLVDEEGAPVNSTRGFLTPDGSLVGAVRLPNVAIATWKDEVKGNISSRELRQVLARSAPGSIESLEVLRNGTAVVRLKNGALDEVLEGKSIQNITAALNGQEVQLALSPAHLIWLPFSLPHRPSTEEEEDPGDVISTNRFEDNEELRYSLRSLEKHAPWVRHIFIVTNGQIPYWLNLDNPRVTIVTHEELFLNKSHLPTYSSPAIESHIHRIKGLAKHFIYFNDDVLLGKNVWPEDFHNPEGGQKVYFAWSVPHCAEGCPPNWINDNYCDASCNVSACDFDGVDCINATRRSPYIGSTWSTYRHSSTDLCNTGCLNSWLGDRYCDAACKVLDCGFDSGDCGTDDYDGLYGISLGHTPKNYTIPLGLTALYFNLSDVFGNSTVTMATCSKSSVVRTAVLSQKNKVLTLTLSRNASLESVQFVLQATNDTGNKTEVRFAITADTATPTQAPYTEHLKTSAMLLSVAEYNDTQSEEFLQHVAMTIQKGDKPINFWVTERPPSSFHPTTPLPQWEIPAINFSIVSDDILPQEVKVQLQTLDREYEEEEWTRKGYLKHQQMLLEPYTEVLKEWETHHLSEVEQQRQLVANGSEVLHEEGLEQSETEELGGGGGSRRDGRDVAKASKTHKDGQDGLSPPAEEVMEDGTDPPPPTGRRLLSWESPPSWVPLEEREEAEVVRRRKEKQLRLEEDLRRTLAEWEHRHGPWNSKQSDNRGSFPWERRGDFPASQVAMMLEEKRKREEDAASDLLPLGARRHLLDTFADSLRHTNKRFNAVYGHASRRVPAHMPHMLNREIAQEMHDKFPEDFDATSSHKLRSVDDMQFSFSYFYYMMSEPAVVDNSSFFKTYDTDETGILSARELRTLLTHVEDLPITLDSLNRFQWMLGNCSKSYNGTSPELPSEAYQTHYDPAFPLVTEDFLLHCKPLVDKLTQRKKGEKKYKFEELGDGDVAFKMVNENASVIVEHLDDLRRNPQKFICINDNMDHSKESAHMAKLYIRDYFESVLPKPSQFELTSNYRNRFLRVKELEEWQREHQWRENLLLGGLAVTLVLAFIVIFWEKILQIKQMLSRTLSPWLRLNTHRYNVPR